MSELQVGSITPIQTSHPGLAVATARAGGVAILDAEGCGGAGCGAECGGEALGAAGANLGALLERAPAAAVLGLRLASWQIEELRPLLGRLAARDHRLVLAAWRDASLADTLARLPDDGGRRVWLEVTGGEELETLAREGWPAAVEGLVLRGLECGGWIEGEPAFLLVQRAVRAGLGLPFFVRGGIGLHTAAACRAAGAAGVLLDDQLLLMPESPLPARWQRLLDGADGKEAVVLGEDLGRACRVLSRRDFDAAHRLERIARELARDPRDLDERRAEWRREVDSRLGWGDPRQDAWPVGQAVGLAALYRDRYRTTGRLIQALRGAGATHLAAAHAHPGLAPGSPLAVSHGTRYPLVQGPMTRVSDTPLFAEAVAAAGALPMLALSLMREAEARELLQQTRERLGERPWGVGILGFVPQERRDEQLRAIAEVRPPFALIAGGRPDQAVELERHGVATYLHVPSPALLRLFLDQGARRFVFEGRECGGHVGPLSSFALWEASVQTLLDHVPAREIDRLHVLFAGGIHDAVSAAMVAALAAPLAERGARVGALLGSAYLFTEEAVTTGAISQAFQDEAVSCTRTVELTTGVGHVVRCAPTPFSEEFQTERRRLIREGASAEEVRRALDELAFGRSRVAAKGLARDAAGALAAVDGERQRREGMFMMGSLATMHTRVEPMEDLHDRITRGAQELIERAAAESRSAPRAPRNRPAQVAVVGVGCLLPGARDAATFWRNVLDRTGSITEIPARRFDWRVLYSPDPKAPDKIISKWGAFFDEVPFDPLRYGIPPNSMKSLSTSQLLALEVTRWALEDAGYEAGDFDRENTAVIVGTGANGDLEQHFLVRSTLPLVVADPGDAMARLPEWTEESFAGVLANVTAGRIANRFDLGGANYTVDAACASSLTVIDLALSELATGRSNAVVAAGLDFEQTPYFYHGFSRVQAFSPRGEVKTFDQDADGIVMGEGAVVLVLKRLADAERDGDRIYGLIQSSAGSSDGKGLGMTAPRSIGQQRALRRAYEEAGCTPASIGLYEAHGTGTPVGDRAELETVTRALTEAGAAPGSCAVGSVKTLVGHTKAAAGMVGLLKALMALHHRTLPPHSNVERPLPALADPATPPYLLREARPWLSDGERPRRAGVSAFGFGGTNFHAVLEEYRGGVESPGDGADRWPCELFVLRAAGRDDLAAELERLAGALADRGAPSATDLALTLAERAATRADLPAVLALVSAGGGALRETVRAILDRLAAGAEDPVGPLGHLAWEAAPAAAPIAFLFPGQGSQSTDMGREATTYVGELRAAFERADRVTDGCFEGPLSGLVFPPSAYSEEAAGEQARRLADTRVAQPAIGALSLGYLDLARRLGLAPAMAAGHSYGELTALHAAGVLDRDDFLRLSAARGRLMAAADAGAMAAVALAADEVAAHLDGTPLVIANRNAPRQTVVAGPQAAIDELVERLTRAGVRCRRLPVSGAFHSPLMAGLEPRWSEELAALRLAAPAIPVYGNAEAAPYPAAPDEVRSRLVEHLTRPVDFVAEVLRMHDDGARCFVELGPAAVLGGLVREILGDRPHTVVSFGAGGTMKGVLDAVGRLLAAGVAVDVEALFAGRRGRRVDLDRREAELPATTWMVDGGRVRRPHEPVGTTGTLPLLDLEAIEEAGRRRQAPAAEAAAERSLAVAPASEPAAAPPVAMNGFLAPAGGAAEAAFAAPAAAASGLAAVEAYRAYQETMRHFLSLQERVMAQVLGAPLPAAAVAPMGAAAAASPAAAFATAFEPTAPAFAPVFTPAPLVFAPPRPALAAAAPAAAAPSPATAPTAADRDLAGSGFATPAPLTVDRQQLTAAMLGMISERTGYPVEMLDPEQDLEADLSVDSIKRIEILGDLKDRLPEGVRMAANARMEHLVQQKTLASLVDAVVRLADADAEGAGPAAAPPQAPPTPAAAEPAAPAAAEPAAPEPATPCPRWVIAAREEGLGEDGAIRPHGLFLITEDRLGVASRLAAALRERQVPVAVLETETLGSFASIERRVRELTAEHGPVQGLAHLAALSPNGRLTSLDEWRRHTQAEVKSLFELLRLTAHDLEGRAGDGGACVLGASLLGGAWGRQGAAGAGAPAAGGIYGLLKTLHTEHPEVHARVVDFDGSLASDEMADIVLREMLTSSGEFEVGYPGGRRTVFTARAEPIEVAGSPPDLLPEPGWVVLVTGGAQGVTAGLARRIAAPGVRMVVVGRSAAPAEEDPSLAALADAAALRRRFLDQARESGAAPTPAQVEQRVQEVLKARAMRDNLAALAAAGVEVEYVAADASRPEGLGAVIEGIYARHGRLDAVLHGVGVIEDRLLRDKTRESFERVFDTKADSTFLLSRALRPQGLRWVVLMSSISGRIGNRGQIDYAAANEVMNRLAWEMARHFPDTRVLSINWGPWSGPGMTSPEVLRSLAARGLDAIEPEAGWRFLRDELTAGSHRVVEVIAGSGL